MAGLMLSADRFRLIIKPVPAWQQDEMQTEMESLS